ncbi:MAG: hypothetical protein RR728_09810, partial [Oscillospiraceae bacterium]
MIQLLKLLPPEIAEAIKLSKIDINKVTEIKLRRNMPVSITINGQTIAIKSGMISQGQIEDILLRFCKSSMAAFEDEISQGFITIDGGHRVGIGGEFYFDKAADKYILKEISSLNIRVAREDTYFFNQDKLCVQEFKSVLLAGAPHSGKTSLAKHYIKELCQSYRIVICDERNELAQNDVNCDVIRGVSKAFAIAMATRTLNPQFIVCDEIGSLDETMQILSAINTGVKFICTAHGESLGQLKRRPNINCLLESRIFERIVFLKQL